MKMIDKMKHVEKVKVIKPFPGYQVDDVLMLDKDNGLFNYGYNNGEDKDDTLVDTLAGYLNRYKGSLSKDDVLDNMGTYFEDISEYKAKNLDQIKSRINDLKSYIEMYKNKDNLSEELKEEKNKAITVWQNMIWELEWVLGMRTI